MPNEVHYTLTLALCRDRKGENGLKDLISDIVKALVDQPEQVTVTETEGGNTVVLEVKVAKSDMGKVIGKRGRHADAIRTILSAAAGKVRKRYVLEIFE
jgi:predicted RNA-binding protein YlqC (UPF0109 family)